MKLPSLIRPLFPLLCSVLLAACGASQNDAGKPAPGAADAAGGTLEPIHVRLDWLAGAYHAPLFVAQERGYYRDAGLDVTISNGQGSISTLQVVGAGNDTIGLANLSALAMAVSKGVPVVAIAGLIQQAPEGVISLASSGITKPSDLEGKRWGAVAGDEAQHLFVAFAEKNGIDLSKIQKVSLNHSAAISALINGDVDFVCAWVLQDGLKIAKIKPIAKPMLFSDSGLNTLGTSFFVTRDTLKAHPDALRRFIAATARGAEDVAKDPELGVDAVMKARPEGSRDVLSEEIAALPPYLHTARSAGHPFGWLAPEDVDEMLQVLKKYYELPASISADQVYDGALLQRPAENADAAERAPASQPVAASS